MGRSRVWERRMITRKKAYQMKMIYQKNVVIRMLPV